MVSNITTNDCFLLEWEFEPKNFFENPLEIVTPHYVVVIDSGRIEARVDPAFYPADHSLRNTLHHELIARFRAVQCLTHSTYHLSKPGGSRIYPDGRRDGYAFVEPLPLKVSVGKVDFIATDSAGNVTQDSKSERQLRTRAFVELAVTYSSADATALSILRSYSAAVNDPSNELIHLYEVRDALNQRFGNDTNARTTLGISKAAWSRLGQLANDEPLAQGRHRGYNPGALREATAEELTESRIIARRMIEAYLTHLNSKAMAE